MNSRTTTHGAPGNRGNQQSGFTLLEMIMSVGLFLIVTGSIYGVLAVGRNDTFRVKQRTELNQQLRVAMNTIGRDSLNAGVHIPREGAALPDNALTILGAGALQAADGDTEPDILTPIVPRNNCNPNDVPTVNARLTDQITFAFSDEKFNSDHSRPVIRVKKKGEKISLGASFDPSDDVGEQAAKVGDLFLFTGLNGAAIGMATRVRRTGDGNYDDDSDDDPGDEADGSNVKLKLEFESGDPMNINRPVVDGPINEALTGGGGTGYRLTWVTYFVTRDGTLIRRLYGNPANNLGGGASEISTRWLDEPLASQVTDMQVQYVLSDGTVSDAPADPALIRMVRVTITARSTELDLQTKLPYTKTIENTFSTRNLVYSTQR